MKIILNQDIAKLGRRHEVVEVPSGYALNKLIPQGLATEATDKQLQKIKQESEKIAALNEATDKAVQDAIEKIGDTTLEIKVAANEGGHLFESLKPSHITETAKAMGVELDESKIHIGTPIKDIGEHTFQIVSGEIVHPVNLLVKNK